ncbi:hypothetical protein R3P38DRAFT_2764195 [Favolaschia claudopus]|uniref:Uncharacterized protein n=1 Tax=Favolaschia claudopus TaxID=2862362 RepID=A0AAW0D5U4_9AGAR
MQILSFLLAAATTAVAISVPRQTETTCVTRWSGINDLIVEMQDRIRVADPTFLTTHYGAKSAQNCGGVDVETYVNNILAVIATPDSYCSINGDGFGGYECEISYL